jgi:protein TonB
MIRYNIPIWRTRQAESAGVVPVTSATAVRWSGSRTANRPSAASLGAAMLLHLTAGGFLLTFVHLPTTPTVLDDQVVALVFAPVPHAEPPPVPTVAAVTPGVPPEPPAPPEAPVLAANPPSAPEAASPTEAPPLPAIPPPPPAINRLATPPVPPPPHPPRQPPPKLRSAKPSRTATAASSPPPPAAPTREAAPPATPSAAPATAGENAAARAAPPAPIASDWQHSVFGWLAAHKTYPDEARRRGEEGRVTLRNASLPPFPAEMPQEQLTVTVQIRYRLSD